MQRDNHLRTRSDFSLVYRAGKRARKDSVVAVVAASDAPVPRVGFATPRRIGGAVRRNRARRRLRAAMHPLVARLAPGTLVVLQATTKTAEVDFQKLEQEVAGALSGAGALHA